VKTLKDLLYKVAIEGTSGTPSVRVNSLSFDSRTIKKGGLFIAQKGVQLDGHDYISHAIDNGAQAVVCESLPKEREDGVTYVVVANASRALGIIASNFFDKPSEKLKLIGITGTNGKTSVASLLYELFTNEGYDCGLLSTVKIKYVKMEMDNTRTTPDAIAINQHLQAMVEKGVTFCFMEVSSHGIAQHRTEGLEFAAGVFTNLTHEHLDYHGNFKIYRDTKKHFFDGLSKKAYALTNLDDKNGSFMLQNCVAKKFTYAIRQHADYKTQILECQFSGMLLKIQNQEVWTSLVGNFNAQNLLAVFAVADLFEVPQLNILKHISQLKSVEGRFQAFQNNNRVTVIVDYAHTPDALENVLETINTIRTRNETLFTLLGCGGNRDQDKRPIMGQKAAALSDKVIFTSDNPRDEDPAEIIAQMIDGVSAEDFKKTLKVTLREEAIAMAGQLAQPGDIVLIAGKGHEPYQEIQGKRYPFNDLEVAQQIFLNT
jgi:UDP-N-acetylmuramoyl-L-alanyl-D-glutamate--2,6-diaminopimelate ligase